MISLHVKTKSGALSAIQVHFTAEKLFILVNGPERRRFKGRRCCEGKLEKNMNRAPGPK